ncbi:MAG: hypothetical protein ACRD5I_03290 [Candidatus Acidiferrales bacterium]
MGPERRRSRRIERILSAEIRWHSGEGIYVREAAETENVSSHGALLRLKPTTPVSAVISLRTAAGGSWQPAEVKRCDSEAPDGWTRLAIDLAEPSEAFWGVSLTSAV